ncbi:MAG: thiolase family protein [Pseudomonadales bacterium]|jgi:acetyl-CoA acyltransferase|nr:thiolase family protein [Pseudomonadales bacterium]MDP4640370.1 thiolase family protein [Pseudomonadales bacterium]MDP4766636.1 thiolase family protein [Pseudomonadales bacterium]MDP4876006.1 thiolase family protein [Pseudomonadales bacterium]MDP4910900.1 thiolase family protein [Pseudomonadales bacterium]
MRDVVIVDSVRTGLAKSFRGTFNLTRPDDMLAHCIDSLLARNSKLDPAEVEDVIVGAASQTGEQGGNIARLAVILSRLPVTTSGTTISRACSSGLNSIAMAATQIASGYSEVMIAGGVESISSGQRQTPGKSDPHPTIKTISPHIFMPMGNTAEVVANRYNITREAQDEFSYQSQMRTAAAQKAGLFTDEIVPMKTKWAQVINKETKETAIVDGVCDRDECNRADTTLEGLAKLKPVFDENGSVTAGNASQLSDGASMTLVMSAERAAQLGLEPLAYFRGWTVAGCEPDEMGIGPVFAIPKLLKTAGLTIQDIDLVELNEAFASQCLYSRDFLGIDPEKYNVNGGSISIGHPFGMTGSRLTGHILRELKRREQKWGIVSMCIGGGMGAAGLFEAC